MNQSANAEITALDRALEEALETSMGQPAPPMTPPSSPVTPPPAARNKVVSLQTKVTAEMERRNLMPRAKIEREREAVRESLGVARNELEILESAKAVVLGDIDRSIEAKVTAALASIRHHEEQIVALRAQIETTQTAGAEHRAMRETEYNEQIGYARRMIRADERKLEDLAEDITPAK